MSESNSILTTLHNAEAGNANGVEIGMQGWLGLTLDLTMSVWTGTVNFEGTIDDANWFSLLLSRSDTGAAVTTLTQASLPLAVHAHNTTRWALSKFRCRTSGVSAGTVTVKARRFTRAT